MSEPLAGDPLTASLEEQVARMRGEGAPEAPAALFDLVREELCGFTVIRPRDWEELRHEYGSVGMAAPYWATAWPSGLSLADALRGRSLGARRVLELGCGLGVPSLAAAAAGGRVLATDGSADAVAFAAHNLALNELEGEVAVADWREPGALLEGGPWDLVLAADVLYLRHNVEALLRALPDLLAPGHGEAIVADPQRAGGRDFVASAKRIFR
ncbi:MAG TPA: methyltransferase domain-containing protein, partial [Thermoleophilaceae bacterium]